MKSKSYGAWHEIWFEFLLSLLIVTVSSELLSEVGSVINIDEEAENQESIETSNPRCVASQCCGVLASNCLKFTAATFSGFHIILIAELHKGNSEINVTLDQLTWIASLNFIVPIGSIANGFLAQRVGSRLIMQLASLSFVLNWLIYHNATSVSMILAGRILYSLTSGAFKTPASAYITEISQPEMRGRFLATYHLAGTFGAFFSLLMGGFLYWRTITLINLVFPVVSFCVVHFIPESPTWLASKGRFEDARAALSWLRGWVEPHNVDTEYQSLIVNVRKSTLTSSNCTSYNGDNDNCNDSDFSRRFNNNSTRERLKAFFKPFTQRSFYVPLLSLSLISFIHYFSGVSVIQIYSMVLFQKMNSPIPETTATAIMGATRILGAFLVFFSIKRSGKKRLVLLSLVTASGAYMAIASTGFFISPDEQAAVWHWIPPLALIIAVFANASGAETVVQMINTEIFPVSIRYIGSAIGVSVGSIMQSVISKIFLYLVEAFTLPGVFFYFVLMNIVALIVYRRIFPETEGRSLEEIEEHYRSGKDVNSIQKLSGDVI